MSGAKPVTVGVDARFLGTGTGLARYTSELLTAMLAANPEESFVIFVRRRSDAAHLPVRPSDVVREANFGHYSVGEQTSFVRLVHASGVDLLFAAHFNIPLAARVPIVMTVHDLILHRHAGGASLLKQALYRLVMRLGVRKARRIIAVSQATADDLGRAYGHEVQVKTQVITEGVSRAFSPSKPEALSAALAALALQPDSYFLYVGNAKAHKNVPALIQAWQASGSSRELILVGAHELGVQLPPGVRRIAAVDDALLAHLYSGAAAFVTISLDEGYCLPVAEALACGCPVVATELPAIAETAQGHARLLPPSVPLFSDSFIDPPVLPEPVRVGEWADAAEQTLTLLRTETRP